MKIITSLFSKDFLLIITLMLPIGAFGQKPQKVAGSEIGPTLIVLDQAALIGHNLLEYTTGGLW